ncbi:MAG TPA: secretin N-terminal domain-containing protein, partial [Gemmata sp.]|nr:secretin N-terminal domain-containing protein [Gemmata sp.]
NDVAEKPKKPVEIEVRGNQLVITSDDKEALDLLVGLARHFTLPRPDENLFKVIRLKNVSAEDAAKTITEIFNGPQQNQPQQGGGGPLVPPGGLKGGAAPVPTVARIRVVADKSSNSIVVIKASPIDLLTIEKLLKEYVDRDSTKDTIPPDEKPKQPKTFELRLQYIKHSDGKQTEVGFYLDSYYPEFDGRGISQGKPTADDVEILIDGKKGRITDLLPGDTVTMQLSPDSKSVTRIELSLKTRLNALDKEADALRQRIQSLEKGK